MRRRAHVLALGLLDNLNASRISLSGIPDLLLSTQVLEMGRGGRSTLHLRMEIPLLAEEYSAVLSPGLNLSAIHSLRLLLSKYTPSSIQHRCLLAHRIISALMAWRR
jgi:hypothetical protein